MYICIYTARALRRWAARAEGRSEGSQRPCARRQSHLLCLFISLALSLSLYMYVCMHAYICIYIYIYVCIYIYVNVV